MNQFYKFAGFPNPFEITEDPESIEAANHVAAILGDPEKSLAVELGVTVAVIDNSATFDASRTPPPPFGHYSIKVGDAKPVPVSQLVDLFNNANPERVRIDLNESGIGTLGPNPLPLPFGYNFAYQSAYMTEPLALDPGPVPANILGYIAGLERKKKAGKK